MFLILSKLVIEKNSMYIIIFLIIISQFILYKTVYRLIRFQNLKSNVYFRVALEKKFKEYEESDESAHVRDEIVDKLSKALDMEIDNNNISDWNDIFTALNAERFFQINSSEPMNRAFDVDEVRSRCKERNKDFIAGRKIKGL